MILCILIFNNRYSAVKLKKRIERIHDLINKTTIMDDFLFVIQSSSNDEIIGESLNGAPFQYQFLSSSSNNTIIEFLTNRSILEQYNNYKIKILINGDYSFSDLKYFSTIPVIDSLTDGFAYISQLQVLQGRVTWILLRDFDKYDNLVNALKEYWSRIRIWSIYYLVINNIKLYTLNLILRLKSNLRSSDGRSIDLIIKMLDRLERIFFSRNKLPNEIITDLFKKSVILIDPSDFQSYHNDNY